MKLLLQVLFFQGYLWRDRFPELHERTDEPPSISWACLGGGAAIALFGLLYLVDGSLWVGTILAAWGAAFVFSCASPLLGRLLPNNEALAVSPAWMPGLVFVVLTGPAIVLTVLNVTVLGLVLVGIPFALSGILFSTGYLREVQVRYLFFASPRRYVSLLAHEPEEERPLASFFTDTYWYLPRQVLTVMLQARRVPGGYP